MGFTPDPRSGKPIIDEAAEETVEAMQAIADFAEAVGNVRNDTTAERNAFQAAPGEYWNDTTDGRLYRWHVTRGWQLVGGAVPYVKTVRTVQDPDAGDPYGAGTTVGLLAVAIANAPAGVYWWSFTVSISGVAAGKGEVRVRTPNSTVNGPIHADSPGAGVRLPYSLSGTFVHAGGDLSLEFADFRAVAGRVHSGVGAIHYVRPLD